MRRNGWMVVLAVVAGTFVVSPWAWAEQVAVTAPQQAITVDAEKNVGIGTSSPEAILHVFRDTGHTIAYLQSSDPSGAVQLRLKSDHANRRIVAEDSGGNQQSQIVFGDNGSFDFLGADIGIIRMHIDPNGDVTIPGDLTVNQIMCVGGTNPPACDNDRVFQPDYPLESIEDHAAAMYANSHLPAVGPTPDDQPGPFQVGQKTLGILHELEKAHIYINQVNNRLKTEERRAAALDEHFVAGRFLDASSRDLKQNIAGVSAEQAIDTVLALSPVRFAYKDEPTEEHLGFIAEDVPELVATADRKTLSTMDVVAVLTKTVQEQQRLLEEKDGRLEVLEQRMARLEGLLLAEDQPEPSSLRDRRKRAD